MKFTTLTALVGSSAAIGIGSHAVETDFELAQADWEDSAADVDSLAEVNAENWLRDKYNCLRACSKRYRFWPPSNITKRLRCNKDCILKNKPTPSNNSKPPKPNSTYKTCDGAIRRMRDQPNAFKHGNINTKFTDISFQGVDAEYWDFQVSGITAGIVNRFKGSPNWKRVAEIDQQPSLWGSQGAHEHGVMQGALGDCWFLAGISALAEHGERVKKMFDVDSYPGDGLFNVKVWSLGKEYTISIDDKLPVEGLPVEGNGQPFLSRKSRNGAWWGPLLEKVAAKYWGNYVNLKGGNVWEAFYMLTGMPSIAIRTSHISEGYMWWRINVSDRYKYPMSASANKKIMGIFSSHAYTLLGVAQVDGNELIKLRNPWGVGEYNGPWSDKSAEMITAKQQGKISHVDSNDGSFYMPINIFRQAFYQVTINYYRDWKQQRRVVNISNNTRILASNPTDQKAILGVVGHSARQFTGNECKDPKQMLISKIEVKNNATNKLINSAVDKSVITAKPGTSAHDQGAHCMMAFDRLKAGTYTIIPNQKTNTKTVAAIVTFGEKKSISITI